MCIYINYFGQRQFWKFITIIIFGDFDKDYVIFELFVIS